MVYPSHGIDLLDFRNFTVYYLIKASSQSLLKKKLKRKLLVPGWWPHAACKWSRMNLGGSPKNLLSPPALNLKLWEPWELRGTTLYKKQVLLVQMLPAVVWQMPKTAGIPTPLNCPPAVLGLLEGCILSRECH
jgi:hypothetical protein